MKILLLFVILIGCIKSPCIIVVDVVLKSDTTVTADATKRVQCGNEISFPFTDTKYKTNDFRFIEIHFKQGERVVRADVVFGFDFQDGIFKRKYDFPDTSPDLMVWKVYHVDKSGWVQYETKIK